MNFTFIGNPLPGRIHLQKQNSPLSSHRRQRRPLCPNIHPRCSLPSESPESSAPEPSSFSSMAAGPPKSPQLSGRLGAKKRLGNTPDVPKLSPKTATDFAAEGIVDDTDDADTLFESADIRFGVGNVADPFREDAVRTAAAKREAAAEQDAASRGQQVDVTGDGSVLKRLLSVGEGGPIPNGASVVVSYTGKLANGDIFDSTDDKKPFEFVVGSGAVIKGWEAGVSTMKVGETAEFEIKPAYAYGRRGMPPVIPGNATLLFTIRVMAVSGGGEEVIKSVQEYNPDVARNPEDIAREYDALMESQAERKANMSWFDRFYIISPFASQTGEAPPWWLNPRLTFIGIFSLVGIAFYFVFISGAIHQGYVEGTVDVNIFK